MKKLLALATIAGVIGLSLVASFAAQKQAPVVKPPKHEIWLKSDILRKIISAENDKSQPANSLTQRYKVVIETTSGQRQTVLIQTQMNEKGDILKANNVSTSKASQGVEVHNAEVHCTPPCRKQCRHTVVWRNGRVVADWYWCFCCCRVGVDC